MSESIFFRRYLAIILIMMFPVLGYAGQPINAANPLNQEPQEKKQDDKKQDTKKSDQKDKPEPDKADIIEVPKARKQSRPEVVAKPNAKVKPIKVVRPKIKKR